MDRHCLRSFWSGKVLKSYSLFDNSSISKTSYTAHVIESVLYTYVHTVYIVIPKSYLSKKMRGYLNGYTYLSEPANKKNNDDSNVFFKRENSQCTLYRSLARFKSFRKIARTDDSCDFIERTPTTPLMNMSLSAHIFILEFAAKTHKLCSLTLSGFNCGCNCAQKCSIQ